ncbi:MAG TPA: hypothetical protein VF060_34825 [Trebonia sp.]
MPGAHPIDADLDLTRDTFWGQPPAVRHAAFARLRALPSPPYFEAPQSPFGTPERGYYALLRHAEVTEASRDPDAFSSAAGVTNILNLPAEFNEYFGSMINMDDPRHARLRRIVSRAFTPRMLQKFSQDVERTAGSIVTALLETGPCDFVQHVSARLPLTIICEMMGIGDEHYDMVLKNTAILLSGSDPEFGSQDAGQAFTQIMAVGQELAGLVSDLAEQRQAHPADDLLTSLATANIDGERLTPPSWPRSSSCCSPPATRPHATPFPTRWSCSPRTGTSVSCCSRTSAPGSGLRLRRSSATPPRSSGCAAR